MKFELSQDEATIYTEPHLQSSPFAKLKRGESVKVDERRKDIGWARVPQGPQVEGDAA